MCILTGENYQEFVLFYAWSISLKLWNSTEWSPLLTIWPEAIKCDQDFTPADSQTLCCQESWVTCNWYCYYNITMLYYISKNCQLKPIKQLNWIQLYFSPNIFESLPSLSGHKLRRESFCIHFCFLTAFRTACQTCNAVTTQMTSLRILKIWPAHLPIYDTSL